MKSLCGEILKKEYYFEWFYINNSCYCGLVVIFVCCVLLYCSIFIKLNFIRMF